MRAWIPIEALWWMGLYGAIGVLAPWLLRWTPKGRSGLDTSPRKLFQRGELGLFGLLLAISVVLGLSGLMAASAWLEDYSRVSQGLANPDQRTWVDSRRLLFLVVSIAFT